MENLKIKIFRSGRSGNCIKNNSNILNNNNMLIITCFMYLLIVGGNLNKTDMEKELENQEQIKFLRDNCKTKNV